MLNEICAYLNNYFDMTPSHDLLPFWFGVFTVENGGIDLDGKILNGQYFRIQNSIFNDGIYKYPATGLIPETFNGKIQALAIPNDLIKIADDIAAWMEKNGSADSAALSPFNSESFAGYSYSKSTGADGSAKNAPIWAATFGGRLARWRKL